MFKLKSTQSGQVLILIALAAIGLVGAVALAIDMGAKFSDRRHAQNAADTAALAAALAKLNALSDGLSNSPIECPPPVGVLPSDVCTALQTAGLDRAGSNGYNNDLVSNTVKVYSPPISGYYAGKESYVQVIITSNVNTYFARVLGISQTRNTVQAVALTKEGGLLADGAMIISYDPDPNCSTGGEGGYSVIVTGSSQVNLNGGGIFLNSDEVCGFKIPNCADLNITSGSGINTVGADNINIPEGCTFTPPLDKNYDEDPIAIPDDVYWPDVPPECSMVGSPSPKFLGVLIVDGKEVEEWLIYPGFYTEFPQYTLLPTEAEVSVGKKSRIYMKSGVYCIDPPMNQDLSWSPSAASLLNGSTDPTKNRFQDPSSPSYQNFNPNGVTLYIRAGGGFTINTNSPTFLDASTTGDYQGYLMVLEGTYTSHPSCTINGGAEIDLNGMIFAPYCDFVINGQAGETAGFNAQIIGWTIRVNGTNAINFNYDPSNQVEIKNKIGLMR